MKNKTKTPKHMKNKPKNLLTALIVAALLTTAISGCKKDGNNGANNYTVTVTSTTVNATEGSQGQISISINPETTEDIVLNLSFAYNTASVADIIVPATYTIPKGKTTAVLPVNPNADFETESSETGTLTITPGASNITVVNGTVAVSIVNSSSTPSGRYLSGLLDNTNFSGTGMDGAHCTLSACGSSNSYAITGGQWIASINPTKSSAKVLMHKIITPGSPPVDASTYYGMIAPGNYTFATNTQNNSNVCTFTNGARISVFDSNNKEWCTAWGDNTTGTFKITYRGTYPGSTGLNTTFAGTYNCKVYDSNGAMKTLSGSFYSYAGLQY